MTVLRKWAGFILGVGLILRKSWKIFLGLIFGIGLISILKKHILGLIFGVCLILKISLKIILGLKLEYPKKTTSYFRGR